MQMSIGSPLPIPELDSVVILGAGVSIDFYLRDRQTPLDRKKEIIITCNGSISITKPTYQICGDPHAIKHWSQHKNHDESVWWIARPGQALYKELHIPHVISNTLIEREYTGTGAEALNIAFYLTKMRPSIQTVTYTGLEGLDIVLQKPAAKGEIQAGRVAKQRIEDMNKENRYCYCVATEVMPYQESIHAPDGWWDMKPKLKLTLNSCYLRQLKSFSRVGLDPEFKSKLVCRSLIDITHLNPRKPDCGIEMALREGFYKI
jgi:hypothetical protein